MTTTWQPSPTGRENVVEATFSDESFDVWDEAIARAALNPDVTHLAIAKDVKRLAEYLNGDDRGAMIRTAIEGIEPLADAVARLGDDVFDMDHPLTDNSFCVVRLELPNLIPAALIHNQSDADRDVPILLSIPAAKRAVIWTGGEVDFRKVERTVVDYPCLMPTAKPRESTETWLPLHGNPRIALIILRPGDAPVNLDHVRSVRDQCEAAGVAFWIESLANLTSTFDEWNDGRREDGELVGDVMHWQFQQADGGDPDEWPADLREHRQWPKGDS